MRSTNLLTYFLTYLFKGVKVAECHVAGETHHGVDEMKDARLIERE